MPFAECTTLLLLGNRNALVSFRPVSSSGSAGGSNTFTLIVVFFLSLTPEVGFDFYGD